MAPSKWQVGARIKPTHDTQICKFADPLRTLCGPDAPRTVAGNVQLSRSGMCSEVFGPETMAAFGDLGGSRVDYTFHGLYDEDLIIVVQATRSRTGNYPVAAVGFARAQDFMLEE